MIDYKLAIIFYIYEMAIFQNYSYVIKAAALLKTIANEKRLKILCALSKGEKSVRALQTEVGLSQSALSQHLAKLRREKVLVTRREAQTIYYSILDQNVVPLLEYICDLLDAEGDKSSS